MAEVKPKVTLLRHTYDAEEIVAMAAKLCYADADMETIHKGVEQKGQSRFILPNAAETKIIVIKSCMKQAEVRKRAESL